MRDAFAAVDARRRDDWDRLSWGLLWIVNRMPTFAKRSRPVPISQLNPYRRAEYLQQRAAAADAGFDALWAIAKDETSPGDSE